MTADDQHSRKAGETSDGTSEEPLSPIIPGWAGARSYSLAALQERIEAQLSAELEGRVDILSAATGDEIRHELVREAGEYVLAVESVMLSRRDKQTLFAAVYSSLFGFGPLDELLQDESVVELSVEGVQRVFVCRESGEREQVPAFFEDEHHLHRIVARLLVTAGQTLSEDQPFVEFGLTLHGRPARLSLVLPPLSPMLTLSLRLHRTEIATLERLTQRGAIGPRGLELLRALACSPWGLLVVGESGSGKTMLLEALLGSLPETANALLVERAVEVRCPVWIQPVPPANSFGAGLGDALDQNPALLVADEIRTDEGAQIVRACQSEARLVFTFRGSGEPARLRAALGMLLRRGRTGLTEAEVQSMLVERLPFVLLVARMAAGSKVVGIREWRLDGGVVDLMPVLGEQDQMMHRPQHDLPLPDGFWSALG